MAEYQLLPARQGRLRYRQADASKDPPHSPGLLTSIQPRYHRPSRIVVAQVNDPLATGNLKKKVWIYTKLAASRDNAFRFLRSVIATHSTQPKTEDPTARATKARRERAEGEREQGQDMPGVDFLRGGAAHRNSQSHVPSPLARPAPIAAQRQDSVASELNLTPTSAGSSTTFPQEKALVSGNGVSVGVNLAEPLLFLQGYDQNDSTTRNTAMLRGSLHLKVQKSAKIKAVTLKFRGSAITKWPEGIPPRKVEYEERDTLMSHTWPFFNAQFPMAEGGSGADHMRLAQETSKGHGSPYLSGSPTNSALNLTSRQDKRLSLQTVQAQSFDKTESKNPTSVAQKGYRMFHPGDYVYNFELPLDSRLPETIDVDLGTVKYELEASVERAGAFRGNLLGCKEVELIRAPTEGSLEQVEPIAISRTWEDQLHYDIVISGKSFPLGSRIPIALKLTPLAKVQCHRIKVFITENIEYFCSKKRVHRMEPTRKVLLYEKRADGTLSSTFPGSTQRVLTGGGIPYAQRGAAARGEQVEPQDTSNLLGRLDQESSVGPTEMEFSVQLPGCQQLTVQDRPHMLNFDTTYQNIQVHHWIKIVMRLSRPDIEDPSKRRHFEISIDSPFHILSCRASQANTALPAYTSPHSGPSSDQQVAACGCPGAPQQRYSPNHVPTLNGLNAVTDDSSSTASTPTYNSRQEWTANDEALAMRPALARPPTAHVHNGPTNGHLQRPMHILRAPSFNPPAFEAEEPPPPLQTPPPQYNDIASPTAGHAMEDYFVRRNSQYPDEEDSSDDDRVSSRGRVNLPLTPGGRVNRSVDLGRRNLRGWDGFNNESGR